MRRRLTHNLMSRTTRCHVWTLQEMMEIMKMVPLVAAMFALCVILPAGGLDANAQEPVAPRRSVAEVLKTM